MDDLTYINENTVEKFISSFFALLPDSLEKGMFVEPQEYIARWTLNVLSANYIKNNEDDPFEYADQFNYYYDIATLAACVIHEDVYQEMIGKHVSGEQTLPPVGDFSAIGTKVLENHGNLVHDLRDTRKMVEVGGASGGKGKKKDKNKKSSSRK